MSNIKTDEARRLVQNTVWKIELDPESKEEVEEQSGGEALTYRTLDARYALNQRVALISAWIPDIVMMMLGGAWLKP